MHENGTFLALAGNGVCMSVTKLQCIQRLYFYFVLFAVLLYRDETKEATHHTTFMLFSIVINREYGPTVTIVQL